ncbi:MAG: alkene reductase [Bacteroidales bacterium]|nr:alkene reductase [Bacteroidales bacterium]
MTLFKEFQLGNILLKNKVVMAPMTRSRAINNIPNEIMATYYKQRSNAGLIITEGTSPSPNGLGYARIPGIFSQEQLEAWKKTTDAVHSNNGKIFVQLMHTGRVSHPNNMSPKAKILAPSAIKLSGQMYTDNAGMQDYPKAKEMTIEEIKSTIDEYVVASKNAIEAGFDGVELHAANGYLPNQFINPASNTRTDEYGGSLENRNRFVLELAHKISEAIGASKTGIRLSPYGVFSDMGSFEGIDAAYTQLATELGKLNLVYIHLVDHSSMGTPAVPASIKQSIKEAFGGTIIISGGLDKATAEEQLSAGVGHIAAFGRSYISNPDLVERMQHDKELSDPNFDLFYTPGEAGYTDYSTL